MTVNNNTDNYYYKTHIPKDVTTLLEAGAFQSLCSHLRERSDEVQNMDLMSLSGFCRNCLAKWLVLEARKLSSQMQQTSGVEGNKQQVIQALDALGYDEAAEEVYGCTYPEWKKRHAKKATDEQMKLFEDSAPLHAKHDKSILQTRGEKPAPINKISECKIQPTTSSQKPSSLLSNVCCQDVDGIVTTSIQSSQTENVTLMDQKQRLPVPPPSNGVNLRIGILTVSDRASANQYETGDLSGPAVEKSILTLVDQMNRSSSPSSVINFTVNNKAIVPDDISVISQTLKQWTSACNLIFTTGGTGFAPRDVTPEATLSVLDRECDGLMTWASLECASSGEQPFAPLSRGTAGICGNSMIANLPGNPKGVEEVMQYVFPMLLHAVKDLE